MARATCRIGITVTTLTLGFLLSALPCIAFDGATSDGARSENRLVLALAQNAETSETPAAPTAEMDAEEASQETPAGQDGVEGEEEADAEAAPNYGRFQTIMELVDAGGPIIIMLAVLSFISLAIILAKIVQFSILRVNKRNFIRGTVDLVCAGKLDEAIAQVSATPGVVARVMEAALKGKALGPEAEDIAREEVTRVAQAKLDGLESGLTFLRLIATISPLLGLLGTVLGMIEAFQQLQGAGDRVDPAILSGGIWEALLTTAAGLSVAIPAAAFYTALQRTVEVTAQAMEDAATQCFTAPLYTAGPAPAPAMAVPQPAA